VCCAVRCRFRRCRSSRLRRRLRALRMRGDAVVESVAMAADAAEAVSARAAKVGAGAEIDVLAVSVRVVRAATTAVCDTVVASKAPAAMPDVMAADAAVASSARASPRMRRATATAGAGLTVRAPIRGNLRIRGSAMMGTGTTLRIARVTGTVRANTRVNLVDTLSITAVVARAAPPAVETRVRAVVRRDHVAPVRSNS